MKEFKSKIETNNLDAVESEKVMQVFDAMVDAAFAEAETITARKQRARISWTVTVEEVPQ